MCSKSVCAKCKKYTWGGCGQHLQNLFKGMKLDQVCQCNPAKFKQIEKYITK